MSRAALDVTGLIPERLWLAKVKIGSVWSIRSKNFGIFFTCNGRAVWESRAGGLTGWGSVRTISVWTTISART